MPQKVIFEPVKPFFISQTFNENGACVSLDGKNRYITCDGNNPPPGYKSLYADGRHGALDLGTYHGQECYAAQEGRVYKIDTQELSGLDVRIEHEVKGLKFRTIYEHLMGYQVKVGDVVTVGQLVGWCDNTGKSSGDHLHFQMELWNGTAWEKVDPLLYMEHTFAKDQLWYVNKLQFIVEQLAKILDNAAYKLRTPT